MRNDGLRLRWFTLLFFCSAAVFPQTTSRDRLFPVPEVIRPNVEFWKKIYAVYPTSTVLIHHTDNLAIVYEVVDLDALGANLSQGERWRLVEEIKKDYSTILTQLAAGRLTASDPDPRVARVVALYGANASPAELRQAANSIRAQLGLKDRFGEGIQRSGIYLDYIKKIFKEHGLPMELSVLPHVESAFNPKAYSKVGAAGMWQFTRYTGKLFMTINYDVDERMDPLRATHAAAELLKKNYEDLGAWPLAVTAYNHGTNGMKRAKQQFGQDFGKIYQNYNSRSFGFASKNFYAEFIAALEVVENYQDYFGELTLHAPADFIEIEFDYYLNVRSVLQNFNIELEEFAQLNPALRPPVLNSERRIPKGYPLRLPTKLQESTEEFATRIKPEAKFTDQVHSDWYKVQRGDNLYSIARQFNTTISKLMEYNNITRREKLYAGTVIKIPSKEFDATAVAVASPKRVPDAKKSEALNPVVSETVVAARTPSASTTPVSATPVMLEEEAISREEREAIVTYDLEQFEAPQVEATFASLGTEVDQIPEIPEEPLVVPETITVEPEETLGHYAEWLEITAQTIRNLNRLAYSQELQIGQQLRLDFSRVGYAEFVRRRNEHHRIIEEDFFTTYQVESLRTHAIRRGETIWRICNDIYEVPLWLVVKYNPDKELSKLNMGDRIFVPIVIAINPEQTPTTSAQD